jgi:hypothetical protein
VASAHEGPYLEACGTLENVPWPCTHHESFYDRTGDEITLDEVERIAI